jgi:hypothetical protein
MVDASAKPSRPHIALHFVGYEDLGEDLEGYGLGFRRVRWVMLWESADDIELQVSEWILDPSGETWWRPCDR